MKRLGWLTEGVVAKRLTRGCVTAGLALSVLLLAGCAVIAPSCSTADLAYVGTDGNQLRALRFDACAGQLAMIGTVADVAKPRWTLAHPTLPIVYAATDGANAEGSVVAYAFDRATGALRKVNEVAAGGAGTTHLALDAPSMTVLAANFGGGSVSSIAISEDGSLGGRTSTIQATGSGPHRRQASAHAHHAVVDPSGRHALVADMGADRVFVYSFDRATRTLGSDDVAHPRSLMLPPGSGPRRALFGTSGRFVYVLNELTADLLVLRWDAPGGRLTPLQSVPLSAPDFQGTKSASELALSRDGRFLYAGNRGENLLMVYQVAPESGLLTLVQRSAAGGEGLWAFDIHTSGRWLLAANYRSNHIRLFAIDRASGRLTDTGQAVESPAPVSVAFVP